MEILPKDNPEESISDVGDVGIGSKGIIES